MRYRVEFDKDLHRWVVADTFIDGIVGIHPKLAHARQQAETLETQWAAFKSFYVDMARSMEPMEFAA